MRRDPVTHEVALYVFRRDGWTCVAVTLGESPETCRGRLTLDHVRDHAAMGGRRAPSDALHLVSLCLYHHLESGWATSHKPALRTYLAMQEVMAI